MSRILVVEDNDDLAFGLRNNLEIEGYDVSIAADGQRGLDEALRLQPDLVILDLMLPGLDGFRVLHELRRRGFKPPILILTARGEETDKVRGLRLGADDYVTKPFGVLELLARVEALLRRSGEDGWKVRAANARPIERFGDVEVDQDARVVRRGGREVALTPKEYELLVALLQRRGAAVSRYDLMQEVWGYNATVLSRTVDTHIAELRRKLEHDPSHPAYIITIRKVGYRLEANHR